MWECCEAAGLPRGLMWYWDNFIFVELGGFLRISAEKSGKFAYKSAELSGLLRKKVLKFVHESAGPGHSLRIKTPKSLQISAGCI